MSFFNILTNVTKAVIAVAVSPVALAVDIVTLPEAGNSGRDPLSRTGKVLGAAGDCITEAITPEQK